MKCFFLVQDLENSLRNHPEERLEKIEELGNEIVGHQCMADSILADVKLVFDRWKCLQNQVRFECFCSSVQLCMLIRIIKFSFFFPHDAKFIQKQKQNKIFFHP